MILTWVTLTCTIGSDRDFFVVVGCTGTAARIWSPRLHPGFGRPRHHSAVSACTSSSLPHPCARPLFLLPAGGKASFASLNHVCVWKVSPSPSPLCSPPPSPSPHSPWISENLILGLIKPENPDFDRCALTYDITLTPSSVVQHCIATMCGVAVDKQIRSQISLFLSRLYICLYKRVCERDCCWRYFEELCASTVCREYGHYAKPLYYYYYY